MSKKKAETFDLSYVLPNRPYVNIHFIDKKGKRMRSSVDVVLNSEYFLQENGEWNLNALFGYVAAR